VGKPPGKPPDRSAEGRARRLAEKLPHIAAEIRRAGGARRDVENPEQPSQATVDGEMRKLAEHIRGLGKTLPPLRVAPPPGSEPMPEPASGKGKRRRKVPKRKTAKRQGGRPKGSTLELRPEALEIIDAWPPYRRHEWKALHAAVCGVYTRKGEKIPSLSTVKRRAEKPWSKPK
jgi:hypothetical protein